MVEGCDWPQSCRPTTSLSLIQDLWRAHVPRMEAGMLRRDVLDVGFANHFEAKVLVEGRIRWPTFPFRSARRRAFRSGRTSQPRSQPAASLVAPVLA
jgi:hypothetical protein